MSCTLTQGNTLDCKDSKGGIKTVYIADMSDTGSTITIASGVVTAWSSAATDFWTYQVRPETSNHDWDIVPSEANGTSFYTHKLTIKLHKMTAALSEEIVRLVQKRLHIIVLDRNGKYWLLGYTNGMTVVASTAGTGTAMGDMNGYTLNFSSNEEYQPYEVSSGIIAAMLKA